MGASLLSPKGWTIGNGHFYPIKGAQMAGNIWNVAACKHDTRASYTQARPRENVDSRR